MYKDFIKKTMLLSKSIVFKLNILADSINNILVENGYEVVTYDKTTWKYYLNLNGEKHISNTSVIIKLLETGEEVELTKSILNKYKHTKLELLKSENYYKELVLKYPTEIEYIKGCINPVDITEAIEAQDGKVLSYNSYYVESNEYNLIEEIEKYLIKILYRWKIDNYNKSENAYVPTLLGIIYNNIPSLILNTRLKSINTPFVHSFLLSEYFKSNGIGKYTNYLNNVSKFWLYRNLEYIKHNIGKDHTLKLLIDNVLTPNAIGIAKLEVSEKISLDSTSTYDKSNINRSIILTPNVLNNYYDTSEKEILISDILESELVEVDPLEGLTDEYLNNYEHELYNITNSLNTLKMNQETTKVLHITPKSLFQFFNNKMESLIYNWAYMLKHNIYFSTVDYNDPNIGSSNDNKKRLGSLTEYTDPNNSRTYNIDSYTGFLILLKLLLKLIGKENIPISKINYYNIINKKLDIDNLNIFNDGFSYDIINKLNNDIPSYPEMVSSSLDFKDYVTKYHDYISKSWITEVNTGNTFVQTNIKIYFENLVEHDSYDIANNETIDELLLKENIEFKISDSFDIPSSIRSIIKTFTGISDEYFYISDEIEAFKKLINKLTSYTTQVINNSKDIDNVVYLYNNNPNMILSKQGLLTLLDIDVLPLEKLDAILHSYIDDYKSHVYYSIFNRPPEVSIRKPFEGVMVRYAKSELYKVIPINIVSISKKDYDILHEDFREVFIKDIEIKIDPLEDITSTLDSTGTDGNARIYTEINPVGNVKTYYKKPIEGMGNIENNIIVKPNNIVSISDVPEYDILNEEFKDTFIQNIELSVQPLETNLSKLNTDIMDVNKDIKASLLIDSTTASEENTVSLNGSTFKDEIIVKPKTIVTLEDI